MATTYTLISSNTLSSDTASVTFSSIPSTYTDLVLKISSKGTDAEIGGKIYLEFNSDTSTKYSGTILDWTGTTIVSFRDTSGTNINDVYGITGTATGMTSIFGNIEIYIPNYTSTSSKPLSVFGVSERNNATASDSGVQAGLYTGTSAISTIKLTTNLTKFASGSTFYLYGIKNS